MRRTWQAGWAVVGLLGMVAATAPCHAAESGPPAPAASDAGASDAGAGGFFSGWAARVREARATQPGWMTPLATVTPRLEQEIRYDQRDEQLGNGQHLANYGGGKGLELIPTTTNEVIINVPPYLDRSYSRNAAQMGSGFADWPAVVVKQRLLSSPESAGNYVVSVFLGVGVPTAADRFTAHYDPWTITPTLAAGKGWGDFDIQTTLGAQIPITYADQNGTMVASNTAFQYHFGRYFWPEFEVNETYWTGGPRGGKFQTFLTPGIIFGRFAVSPSAKAVFGVGYQIAVTPRLTTAPALVPVADRTLLFTARLGF